MTFSVVIISQILAPVAARAPIGIPDSPGIPWLRIILVLLLCLAVSVGAIFAIRRFNGRDASPLLLSKLKGISGSAEIDIVETRRASVHGHVCLFHCRGNAYLVAMTAGGTTLIDKMPLPDGDSANQ